MSSEVEIFVPLHRGHQDSKGAVRLFQGHKACGPWCQDVQPAWCLLLWALVSPLTKTLCLNYNEWGDGKARVIIGDTLSKCEALGRIEMLSFCTFKDFFITPNSLHLYYQFRWLQRDFLFNPSSTCILFYSVEWASPFLFCPLCAMHQARHQGRHCEQSDMASAILELRAEWTSNPQLQ